MGTNYGGWNASDALLLRKTGGEIDIYVADGVGSDSNPGTIAAPLATVAEAVRRLNFWATIAPGNPGATIHIGSGTYQWTEALGPFNLGGPVFVYGDGAGQVGDDGFTELVASSAAGAGSGSAVIVTGGGLTENQYQGKTIEVLTGAAAGDRRTIRSNTTTNLIPSANFSAAVAQNDTYRIVEPAVIFDFARSRITTDPTSADYVPLAYRCGGQAISPLSASNTAQVAPFPAVYFANVAIRAETAGAAGARAYPAIVASTVAFFGVELNPNALSMLLIVDSLSQLRAGVDLIGGTSTIEAIRPWEAGYATGRRSWIGWGTADVAGGSFFWQQIRYFCGFVTMTRAVEINAGDFYFLGGSIIVSTTTASAFVASRWARIAINSIISPAMLVRMTGNAAALAALEVRSGAHVELQAVVLEKSNQGYALLVHGDVTAAAGTIPGMVSVDSGVTLTGETDTTAPTNAICVTTGGQVTFLSNPSASGWTAGTQLCVRKGGKAGAVVQECDIADLVADGDALPAQPVGIRFYAAGVLTGFADGVVGTFTQTGSFGGTHELVRNAIVDTIRLTQMVDGGGGTTTVEVFRRRAGANTSLGEVSLAQGGGAFAQASLTPSTAALRDLRAGDLIIVQFTARQTTTAADVIVELLGSGTDGRNGWIMRQ